jgi:hypothetical protein
MLGAVSELFLKGSLAVLSRVVCLFIILSETFVASLGAADMRSELANAHARAVILLACLLLNAKASTVAFWHESTHAVHASHYFLSLIVSSIK